MMSSVFSSRQGVVGLYFAAAVALAAGAPQAAAQVSWLHDGKAGFVVSHIQYALPADHADETGACPDGFSKAVSDIFTSTPEGQRREGESDGDYTMRIRAGGMALTRGPNGEDSCQNPEALGPDPHFRTVSRSDIPIPGIDLTGYYQEIGATAPGTCPYQSFVGVNGETGIDNQIFRVLGCIHGFQSTGQAIDFNTNMLTGEWGILITLSGVDDIRNDDHVEVSIYANGDPLQVSAAHEPIEFATYAVHPDARFHTRTTGRIVDGVLMTDPADINFQRVTNALLFDRPLRDGILRLTLGEDGIVEGHMAGYTPVEAMYDMQFGHRNGVDAVAILEGERIPRRGAGQGASRVLGYTCNGVYHALYEQADGHPDPQSGACTSISTQYRLTAIPAFVVDEPDTVAGGN